MLIYLFSISSLYLLCFQPLYIIFISMVQIVCYDGFLRAFICLWWITYNREGKNVFSFSFLFTFSSFFCPFILTLTLKSNSLLCSYSSCFQTWTLVNSQVQVLPGVAFFHNRTFCVFLELLTFIFGYGDTCSMQEAGHMIAIHLIPQTVTRSIHTWAQSNITWLCTRELSG